MRPSSVRVILFRAWEKRLTENSFSSSRMAPEMAGWVTYSFFAAAVMLWHSTAVQKYSSCVSFMGGLLSFLCYILPHIPL